VISVNPSAACERIIEEEGGLENIDRIDGVSGGVLVGAMMSMDELALCRKLFLEVKEQGIPWYLKPAPLDDLNPFDVVDGWYSTDPLYDHVLEHVRPRKMQTEFYAGITDLDEGMYKAMPCHSVGRKKCAARIVKSCVQPWVMQMPGTDGDGGILRVTAFPDGLQAGDKLYAVVAPPIGIGRQEKLPRRELKNSLQKGKRVIELFLDVVMAKDLLELEKLARVEGVEVILIACPPGMDPGEPFDTDPIKRRLTKVGKAMWDNRIRL